MTRWLKEIILFWIKCHLTDNAMVHSLLGTMWPLWVKSLAWSPPRHQILVQMLKAKVLWLFCISRLVSKTDNVIHFACLVKQASVDLVSYLFVYYRLGCEPFVCSWGLHKLWKKYRTHINTGWIQCEVLTTLPFCFSWIKKFLGQQSKI